MGHPARNYHDAVAFTLMNYAISSECDWSLFWCSFFPFSTHKPCSRTDWVQADRLVSNSYHCNYSMNEKDSTTAIYITLYNIIAIFWAPSSIMQY
jgi:hypothetical protein